MSPENPPRPKLPRERVTPNPHGAESRSRVRGWVRALELTDDATAAALEHADPALFGACVIPHDGPEVVDLCAQYFAWLILFDDAVGECHTPEDVARLQAAVEAVANDGGAEPAPLPSVERFARAIRDLSSRGHRVAPALPWRRTFEHSVLDYMDGCLCEARLRLRERVPSFSEYPSVRRRTIGALPVLDILELTLPEPLPATGMDRARLRDVRERASYLFAWANDILTYKACRSEKDEQDRLNLVSVLLEEGAASVEAAFEEAARLYAWELERLAADLGPWLSGPHASVTARYARAVLAAVDGNATWYEQSRRYRC